MPSSSKAPLTCSWLQILHCHGCCSTHLLQTTTLWPSWKQNHSTTDQLSMQRWDHSWMQVSLGVTPCPHPYVPPRISHWYRFLHLSNVYLLSLHQQYSPTFWISYPPLHGCPRNLVNLAMSLYFTSTDTHWCFHQIHIHDHDHDHDHDQENLAHFGPNSTLNKVFWLCHLAIGMAHQSTQLWSTN